MPKHTVGHDTKHLRMAKNYCFVCGKDNPHGMHLKFYLNDAGDRFVCRMRLSRRYWGPPRHAHGGIIATILDEAMGKVNKLRHVIALTSRIEIEYLKPVPLGEPLMVESWEKSVRGRRHTNVGEIRNEKGDILARARAVFVAVDPHKMFAKHLAKSPGVSGVDSPAARNGARRQTR